MYPVKVAYTVLPCQSSTWVYPVNVAYTVLPCQYSPWVYPVKVAYPVMPSMSVQAMEKIMLTWVTTPQRFSFGSMRES